MFDFQYISSRTHPLKRRKNSPLCRAAPQNCLGRLLPDFGYSRMYLPYLIWVTIYYCTLPDFLAHAGSSGSFTRVCIASCHSVRNRSGEYREVCAKSYIVALIYTGQPGASVGKTKYREVATLRREWLRAD